MSEMSTSRTELSLGPLCPGRLTSPSLASRLHCYSEFMKPARHEPRRDVAKDMDTRGF